MGVVAWNVKSGTYMLPNSVAPQCGLPMHLYWECAGDIKLEDRPGASAQCVMGGTALIQRHEDSTVEIRKRMRPSGTRRRHIEE